MPNPDEAKRANPAAWKSAQADMARAKEALVDAKQALVLCGYTDDEAWRIIGNRSIPIGILTAMEE